MGYADILIGLPKLYIRRSGGQFVFDQASFGVHPSPYRLRERSHQKPVPVDVPAQM